MPSPAEVYLETRAEYVRIAAQAGETIGLVQKVAAALQSNPTRFMFSNCEPGMPAEVAYGRGAFSFDANHWPTAQRIQERLVAAHAARTRMQQAWDAVPSDIRPGLQPPPKTLGSS